MVDDAEDTRELFALALHEAGFDVATAADGSEAVASALIAMPGVIVMDLAMPVMDGCQATRHIRAADPTRGAYIIALTAFDGPEWAARARASGCDEVLRKPCTCALLITCIEAAISRR